MKSTEINWVAGTWTRKILLACGNGLFNWSRLSKADTRQSTKPSLVHIMALSPVQQQAITSTNNVNWTLTSRLQSNLNQNMRICNQENKSENDICKVATILFWPKCVKPCPGDPFASMAEYRQVSNIRCIKSQHLKDSRTVLWLSLPNS